MTANGKAFDIAVIGGGIHGCGIARDAAGRGLSVLLCEAGDLGGATSSASTKLVHGGLRYLEHGALRLVKEALTERETLLRAAPHLIRPLRFVMPATRSGRPAWMLRCGLLLYDLLARRDILPPSQAIDLRRHPAGESLRLSDKKSARAFCYSDCWADDARLVVANAIAAREAGADIRPGVKVEHAKRDGKQWNLHLRKQNGDSDAASARALINAAGPWVDDAPIAREDNPKKASGNKARLVKGSHIIVPQMFSHSAAYLLQNRDGRVIFAIPYEEKYTLIGATDIEFSGDPATARISDEEINYLCAAVGGYFAAPPTPADVVDSFAGVRALADDGSNNPRDISRDYKLRASGGEEKAPLIEIVGGKLTTYRKLAEAVIAKLAPALGEKCERHRTKTAPLPGGDLRDADGKPTLQAAEFSFALLRDYPYLHPPLAMRLSRAYGTKTRALLGDAKTIADLGANFGGDFYEREADYLKRQEWTTTAQSALHRRSKLYLHLDKAARDKVAVWFGK